MKKIYLVLLFSLIFTGVIACGKTDVTTKPTVDCDKNPSDETCPVNTPVFEGVDSITIPWGKEFDAKAGVKAVDKVDGDITKNITVTGTIDIFKSSKQSLEYKVTNKKNLTTTITREITVDYAKEQDLIDITKNKEYAQERENQNNFDLKQTAENSVPGWQTWGMDGKISNAEEVLKVEVSTKYFQVSNNHNDLIKNQKYIVLFDAKADELHRKDTVDWTFKALWGTEESGWDPHREVFFEKNINTDYQTFAFMFQAKTATENVLCLISQELKNTLYFKNFKIFELFPVEKTIPTIDNCEDVTLTWGQDFDVLKDVTAYDATDKDLTSKIVVDKVVNNYKAGEYEVVYKVKNSLHIVTVHTRKVTVLAPTTKDLIAESKLDKHLPYTKNNIDLSNGVASWGSWGLGGPFVNEDNTLKINTEATYYQVSNNGNEWNTNQDYIFTFKIKADKVHTLPDTLFNFKIIVGSEFEGWNPYFDFIYPDTITTDWQEFAFTVNIKNGKAGCLLFVFEHVKNLVQIKDITITEMFPKIVPTIQGNTDLSVDWNTDANLLQGVTAMDEIDGDVTSKIVVSGFDKMLTGIQNVKLSVTNSKGGYTEVFRKIKVGSLSNEKMIETKASEANSKYDSTGTNLDLSEGSLKWTQFAFVPGGTFTAENSILDIKATPDYLQIANGGHTLDSNSYYLFSFDIKALVEQTSQMEYSFRIIIGSEEEGWREDNIVYFDQNISTDFQTFNFVIKPKHNTKNVVCFIFQGVENTINIKNIDIYKLG